MIFFKTLLLIVILITTTSFVSAQSPNLDDILLDHIYKENIKTLQIHKEGWALSAPIIALNTADRIQISFDDLTSDIKNYSYTIVHCDANWRQSDIMPADYIEGFTDNKINDYTQSFNTLYQFIHYNLFIPNEDIKPKLSGNYIVKIYENYDSENIVAIKRFCISDNKIEIQAQVKQATLADLRSQYQEIDFSLFYNLPVNDVFNDIKVVLTQNNRWDNAITGLKPLFIKDKELEYSYDEENTFLAGNEYRRFDLKSIRYQSDRIKGFSFEKPYYHVLLYDDENRHFKQYFSDKDLNGRYFIENSDAQNAATDADYVYVHFSLPYEEPLASDIYIFGALSNWNINEEYKMTYNVDLKKYEATILLKQGFYNYSYAYLDKQTNKVDETLLEGSHYETENDYIIYVYYKNISLRYDQLVGVKFLNTQNKQ